MKVISTRYYIAKGVKNFFKEKDSLCNRMVEEFGLLLEKNTITIDTLKTENLLKMMDFNENEFRQGYVNNIPPTSVIGYKIKFNDAALKFMANNNLNHRQYLCYVVSYYFDLKNGEYIPKRDVPLQRVKNKAISDPEVIKNRIKEFYDLAKGIPVLQIEKHSSFTRKQLYDLQQGKRDFKNREKEVLAEVINKIIKQGRK